MKNQVQSKSIDTFANVENKKSLRKNEMNLLLLYSLRSRTSASCNNRISFWFLFAHHWLAMCHHLLCKNAKCVQRIEWNMVDAHLAVTFSCWFFQFVRLLISPFAFRFIFSLCVCCRQLKTSVIITRNNIRDWWRLQMTLKFPRRIHFFFSFIFHLKTVFRFANLSIDRIGWFNGSIIARWFANVPASEESFAANCVHWNAMKWKSQWSIDRQNRSLITVHTRAQAQDNNYFIRAMIGLSLSLTTHLTIAAFDAIAVKSFRLQNDEYSHCNQVQLLRSMHNVQLAIMNRLSLCDIHAFDWVRLAATAAASSAASIRSFSFACSLSIQCSNRTIKQYNRNHEIASNLCWIDDDGNGKFSFAHRTDEEAQN